MKNLKFIFLTFLLSFIIFCTRPPREPIHGTYDPKTLIWLPETYNFERTKSFNYSFDEIWFGIIDFLRAQEMRIQTIDKASGIIILQEWILKDSTVCDCGQETIKIKTYRGWERRPTGKILDLTTINSTIYCKYIDSTHTNLEMINDFRIIYRSRTNKGILDLDMSETHKSLGRKIIELPYPDELECVSTGRLESWFFQTMETKLSSKESVSPKDH